MVNIAYTLFLSKKMIRQNNFINKKKLLIYDNGLHIKSATENNKNILLLKYISNSCSKL